MVDPYIRVGRARARLLGERSEVDAITSEWRDLPPPAAAPGFATGPDFFAAWHDTVGVGAAPRVVELRDSGRLVGVLPLVAVAGPAARGGRQVRLAGSRLPPMTDMADVMVEPGYEIALATAAVALLERTAGTWDTLYLGNVAAESRTFAAMVGQIEARGWALATRARTAMVMDTDGDWEAFRAGLGRSTRRLPRRLERLRGMGDLRVQLDLTGPAGEAALEDLFAVYRERWGRGNWFDDPAYREWARRMWRALAPGEARIAGIWLDGRPLALHLIFRQGTRDQSLIVAASRDPRTAAMGPGALLDYLVAERAFADDTTEVHLLHTVLQSKLIWTTRFLTELIVTAVSPAARTAAAASVPVTEAAIVGRRIRASRRRPA